MKIWNLQRQLSSIVASNKGHVSCPITVSFDPNQGNNSHLLSGERDGLIILGDLRSPSSRLTITRNPSSDKGSHRKGAKSPSLLCNAMFLPFTPHIIACYQKYIDLRGILLLYFASCITLYDRRFIYNACCQYIPTCSKGFVNLMLDENGNEVYALEKDSS